MTEEIKIEFPEEVKTPPTIEELAEKEGEFDSENPDKTPNKYNLMAEKYQLQVNDLAKKIFDEYIITSDLPFAFIEILTTKLAGLISIHKGKAKLWDARCRADNKFHLTPIKDLEIYESIAEENKESENLDS